MIALTKKEIETLCKINMEYFYLASLVSADNIITMKDAEEALEIVKLNEVTVNEADIPEEKKNEFFKYFEEAKEIFNSDIRRFKEEKNNDENKRYC